MTSLPEPDQIDPWRSESRAHGITSLHVRRILEEPGEDSWVWLVQRFNPLLEVQAAYRLRGGLRRLYDPQDLINEAWMVAFFKLRTLNARDGRMTPVLLKFLSSTLLNKLNEVVRREIQRNNGSPAHHRLEAHPSEVEQRMTSALSHSARSEAQTLLAEALASLSSQEREVVVLRGIEQLSNKCVADQLGEHPSTVAMRWSRTLAKLRQKLPNSVFEDLLED